MKSDEAASAAGPNTRSRSSRSPLRALRNRDFALYWSGLLISATGSWMQIVAQGWLVFGLTHSKLYLGIVSAAGTLPLLFLTLPGGVIADRFNKRRIVIVTQTLAVVQALAMGILVYSGLIKPWHIVGLALFSGVVNSLDVPARQAMTFEIVGREDLMNAVALNSSAFNGARVIGPAIAGEIIALAGPAACFILNAVSYLGVIVSLLIIRPTPLKPSDRDAPMLSQIREGLGYARRNIAIRDILILTAMASIFALQYSSLMPALAKDVLGVGPRGLGRLMAATGLGAVAAALSVAAMGHHFKTGAIVSTGSILASVGIIALSTTRSYPLSLVSLVVIGFGMMMFLAVSNSMVQMASPDELRGRMLSVRTLVFMGLAPIGALQIGWMAQRFGVQRSLLVGGLACLVTAVCFAIFSPASRDSGMPSEGAMVEAD